jgi:peptidoglycan/LPS O-acetylase OafA/YrhL
MGQQIRSLQALRGIDCLAVVIFHTGTMPFGWAGVDLFFVLSGFVITWTQSKHLGRPSEFRGYLGRRLWRIYPPYWAYWVVALVAYRCFLGVPFGAYSGFPSCRNQLLLWPWSCRNHYLQVAWSLSYEVMFYLIFGLFVLAPRRWFPRLLALWTTAVIGRLVLAPVPATGEEWMPLYPLTLEFLTGCWAAMALQRGRAWAGPCLASGLIGLAGGLTLLAVRAGNVEGMHVAWRAAVLGPPIGLAVYGIAGLELAGRFRLPNWLCPIGDASYSIYLTHTTVGTVVAATTIAAGIGWPLSLPWALTLVAGQIAIGWLGYRCIESPLLRLAQRKKRSGREESAAIHSARAA